MCAESACVQKALRYSHENVAGGIVHYIYLIILFLLILRILGIGNIFNDFQEIHIMFYLLNKLSLCACEYPSTTSYTDLNL